MKRKKERKRIYIAPFIYCVYGISKRSGMDHTVLPANTPCLPFLRLRSLDGATCNWGKRYLIAAYYSPIDPKGWKAELAWLVDPYRTFYPHKWSPVSYCRSSAGQRKYAGRRRTFYHWATQPTRVSIRVRVRVRVIVRVRFMVWVGNLGGMSGRGNVQGECPTLSWSASLLLRQVHILHLVRHMQRLRTEVECSRYLRSPIMTKFIVLPARGSIFHSLLSSVRAALPMIRKTFLHGRRSFSDHWVDSSVTINHFNNTVCKDLRVAFAMASLKSIFGTIPYTAQRCHWTDAKDCQARHRHHKPNNIHVLYTCL